MIILLNKKLHIKKENEKDSEFNLGPIETEPGFDFSTKINDLKRYIIDENKTQDIIRDGDKSKIIINRKTIYDLYILSEEESIKSHKNLYNKTYLAAVAIASECISTENKTCEPKRLVDFMQNYSNIRILDEIENLKDIPIYLCLFNFTNNNIILSMTCPESLSEFKKRIILSDLNFFKPTLIKRINKEKRNISITQMSKGKNYIIREKNGGSCNFGNQLNSLCTNDINITKDIEGNIISLNEENVIKNVKNKNNSFLQNKIIKLKDITNETKNFSSKKYLKILNKILSKLKNYMKLNECMSQEDFHEIYKENKGQNKTNIIRRNLIEMQEDKPFIKDNFENLLSLNNYQEKYEYDIILKNDIFYNEYQQSSIEINVNDNKYEIANVKRYNNLNYIIRQIISLNKQVDP